MSERESKMDNLSEAGMLPEEVKMRLNMLNR